MKEAIMGLAAAAIAPDPLRAGVVDVDVTPIHGEGWRVSISGADRSNPFALLGFITPVHTPEGELFQVCVIGHPGAEIEKASLDEAIDVLRPAVGEVEAILAGIRH
jgi:hypothetical protein